MNEALTPVIVGTGQLVDRQSTLENHHEPIEMLTITARLAAEDAHLAEKNLAGVDTVAMVGVAGWHPQNAPGFVAEKLGMFPDHCFTTGIGGQVGVSLVNFIGEKITRGESQFALIGGCNNLKILLQAVSRKVQLNWARGGSGEADLFGGDEAGNTELERKYGLIGPPDIYPVFENALRGRLGLSLDEHQKRMGRLFTRFTEVASENPYAWFPVKRSADELTRVTPANRMISWPYPKYLNAILNTEQAASLLMMSVARARKLGIPESNWVYWQGGASSQEQAYWMSERPDFSVCPSLKDAALSALFNSARGIDEIHHFDFYSCFPVAVQMTCDMLGIDVEDPRGFTVTGGLPYAGGPASAYTLHSMAAMVTRLRGETAKNGLVTGNGWFLTKHAATVLSSDPHPAGAPAAGLMPDLPSRNMATEACPVNEQATGNARIEAYTVKYNRQGEPERGIVLGRTDNGERFLANTTTDVGFLTEFVKQEQIGTEGKVSPIDGVSTFSVS